MSSLSDEEAVAVAGTVMVVDDDPAIRRLLTDALEHRHYRVICASDGGDALRLLRSSSHRPCLILLDFNMPRMDASQFRAEQLQDRQFAMIPVVLLSAHPEVENTAKALCVAAVLPKPVRLATLLAVVRQFCVP